jgi:hypothetical protein
MKRYSMEIREVGSSDYECDPIEDLDGLYILHSDYEADLAAVKAERDAFARAIDTLNGKVLAVETERIDAQAERDAAVAALRQIADPNAFLHSGDGSSLARRYEEIAQAALER